MSQQLFPGRASSTKGHHGPDREDAPYLTYEDRTASNLSYLGRYLSIGKELQPDREDRESDTLEGKDLERD